MRCPGGTDYPLLRGALEQRCCVVVFAMRCAGYWDRLSVTGTEIGSIFLGTISEAMLLPGAAHAALLRRASGSTRPPIVVRAAYAMSGYAATRLSLRRTSGTSVCGTSVSRDCARSQAPVAVCSTVCISSGVFTLDLPRLDPVSGR
eukprot:3940914-Rhodomonas_salina.1